MFKRNFRQFLDDVNESPEQQSVRLPGYFRSGNRLLGSSSTLPAINIGPPSVPFFQPPPIPSEIPVVTYAGVQDSVPRRNVIQNRRLQQIPYNRLLTQRENLLSNTGISQQYENQSLQYRANIDNAVTNDWIFSRNFYEGAYGAIMNMTSVQPFAGTNANSELGYSGITEFMQFLENLIQRFMSVSARDLQDLNQIDSQSYQYTQRLLSEPRATLNQNIRELFFRYYNGSADGDFGNIRWNGDIRQIIERVIDQIQRHFRDQPDLSKFGQLLPTLSRRTSTVGGVPRYTYELSQNDGREYLMLLFSLVMIRLPSVNVARNNVMRDISNQLRFPIRFDTNIQPERLQVSIADGNLRNLFYFIPEHQRVVGLWNNVAYVSDDPDGNQRRPFFWNYKTDLLRSILVRLQIPTRLRDAGGELDFEYLFSDESENLYRLIRESNPFSVNENEHRLSRYYVSLTVYADRRQSVLHIPWILEGSLTNGEDFDIEFFLQEYQRILINTESGRSLSDRASDVDVFYFYFMLLHDPYLPLSRLQSSSLSQSSLSQISSLSGISVGAPYAGTVKEKHFLLGSLVSRFKSSAALFRVPGRKMNTCLMMSLMKCQLYEYKFQGEKCIDIRTTGTNRNMTCCYHVESIQNWNDCERLYPFLEYYDNKWYIKMFNCMKYKDEKCYIEGCLDEMEEDAWEKAAEEIWFHLENAFQRKIEYTSLEQFGQAFCDFFNVCLSIYDVEMRCNRVHVISPNKKSPFQLVTEDNMISMIHIVFDQGHIHPITHFQAFYKSQARKDCIRLHNYCPVCDQKQTQDMRKTKQDTLDHITKCIRTKFHSGFDKETKKQRMIHLPEIKLEWRKNKKGKMESYYACQSCREPVQQQTFLFHTCCIKPKKNEVIANSQIYVYDLECAQFIDELDLYKHECNCLYIRKVYPENDIEKQGVYFPSEIEFLDEIEKNPVFTNSVFIAHNGGNYDVHFILRVLERREIAHTYVPSPTSKHKFIQIHITEKNIRFIDFMRFVPGSLKNIAESFQIPVSKGDFPHRFNNGKHDLYIGRFPSKDTADDYWNIHSFRSKKDEEIFYEWYEKQLSLYCSCDDECLCDKEKWNFQTEIKKYCYLDVVVLAEIVKAFRTECMNFQNIKDDQYPDSTIPWTAPCLDPLQFMTLPQITIQTLVQGFEDVSIVSYNHKRKPNQSWKAMAWLHRMQENTPFPILHRGNCLKDYYDFDTHTYVDGICLPMNTIYLFIHCDYWACPICYYEKHQTNDLFPARNLYASEIRDAYEQWIMELSLTYKIISIWEHDFDTSQYEEEDISLFTLMKPEDAFYGGRTEVFQLYAHAEKCSSEIQYYDVTSLYPSVYAHHPLPIGRPIHLLGDAIDHHRFHPTSSNRYFGFARIHVIPNKSDLLGLLPQRDPETGRLFFPVIPMTGCWGTEEIFLAMQNGYVVTKIYELYYWEPSEYSDQHLRGYVGYFLRMKQEAEGWKKLGASSDDPSEEEKVKVMNDLYIQNGSLGKIRIEKVEKNAVKRQLAKLYLNALWGKFAQKSSKAQHTTVYGMQQFLNLWNDKTIHQSSCMFREISPGVYKASYNLKEEFIEPVRHGNIFIAAKVTETARCVLHRQMLRIGPERVIYCDTDSIIFLWDKIQQLTGVGLGKWTNEYPNEKIIQVYALAPKLYSLQLEKKDAIKETFRAKGVQMTLENQEKMTFERVKPLIESILRSEKNPLTIAVNNFTIFTNSGNNALPYGQVFSRYNEKKVRAIITKRIFYTLNSIDWEQIPQLRTFPVGYEGLVR